MRNAFLILMAMMLLAACATAEVVASDNGTHTLRVEGAHADNVTHVSQAMNRRAGEVCPKGWEKISERAQPSGKTWAGNPATAFEWQIRCL